MQADAAKKLIKETFERPFDKQQFTIFIKNLLNHIEEAPFTYRGNCIFDDFKDKVESLERIGKYTDQDGNKADVLIVHLKRATSLERARTAQRQFVAKYLKGSRGGELKDAALVAFVSPDEEDWRFSFVKMEYKIETTDEGRIKAKEEFTPAKRYSFLVGKNENSHTAQSQLMPILQDTDHDPTLKEIEERFGVEKVTKEFFEKYRELFLEIKEALDDLVEKDKSVKADFESKGVATADFAKKLLGQIVFLYFLQKKGWFGVAKKAAWGTGSKKFLRELFERKHGEYRNFFNDILEPLFYNTLAVSRKDDYSDRFDCKIPFLNGGLFDPLNDYDWVHTDILLPDRLFSNNEKSKAGDVGTGILDVFDRYNFTVKEDEPLEKEVAIDPEMLGKVFENLLEVKDRKSKGTYYTPREIVHYMCRESLINYLATELDGEVPRQDIETLVKYGESALDNDTRVMETGKETKTYSFKLPESVRDKASLIDKKLVDIKVCDPAVGSGAFLVGMMTEIVRSRLVLKEFVPGNHDKTAYHFKLECIQNSLYGVDIDPGAVEIAKLRLWLSLVVDEEDYRNIKPLPNLDYKIMQGNSLISEFMGIDFDNGDEKQEKNRQAVLGIGQEDESLIKKFERKKIDFQNEPDRDKKAALKKEIEDLMIEIFEARLKNKYAELKALEDKAKSIPNLKKRAEYVKNEKAKFFKKQGLDLDNIERQLRDLTTEMKTKQFFPWKLYFAEVFEKGGFDVIIANPPYLESRNSSFDRYFKDRLRISIEKRWNKEANRIQRGADLLIYFLELAIYLVRRHGTVLFLTQNSWLDTEYGRQFQSFLLDHTSVKGIVDSDFKYFDARTGPNINTVISIFVSSEKTQKSRVVFARFHKDLLPYAGQLWSNAPSIDPGVAELKYFDQDDKILRSQKWGTLLTMSEVAGKLLYKLEKYGKHIATIGANRLSIGQGLNLTKDYLFRFKDVNEHRPLRQAIIPILTSADGAPFRVEHTEFCLLDKSKVSLNCISSVGFTHGKLFDLSKTARPYPRLILPRGIGRHYCAWNEVGAYSSSGVDIYASGNEDISCVLLRLWAFLNSSAAWLLREIFGRKNLGGGMLKAEAIDLKRLPIYLELPLPPIKRIFDMAKDRQAERPLLELNSEIHGAIDELVFGCLGISGTLQENIVGELKKTIESRQAKSKT